jgi:DNA topoisomerase IA
VGKVHSPLSLSADFRSHVIHAAQHPIDLDDRQANAVAARIELDLRIGAAFTRLQTLQLQNLGEALHDRILSYGMLTINSNLVNSFSTKTY